jgi:helix-turn-helix protein
MGQSYQHFGLEERCEIAQRHAAGQSIRQIAAALDRAPSSISRELKRNSGTRVAYKPSYASAQAKARRWRGSKLLRNQKLQAQVLDRLARGWSPQQVAGRLAREHGHTVVSHETIYRFIAGQLARTQDYSWRLYLPRAKSKRGWRGRKGGSPVDHIKDRISIALRPAQAADRAIPGHWEADLMLFRTYGQAVLTLHERTSRVLGVVRQPTSPPPSQNSSPACLQIFAAPSPSTTAPSSPTTPHSVTTSASKPSSATLMPPGKKAASKTPSDDFVEPSPVKQISPPSPRNNFVTSPASTTTRRENVWTSEPRPRPSWKRCTSNVNPPARFRGHDAVKATLSPRTASWSP